MSFSLSYLYDPSLSKEITFPVSFNSDLSPEEGAGQTLVVKNGIRCFPWVGLAGFETSPCLLSALKVV